MLGLFLAVLAMAHSTTLHLALHPAAGSADHHCAVTLLASGQVDSPAAITTVVLAQALTFYFPLPESPLPTDSSFLLPLSRGPPALLS